MREGGRGGIRRRGASGWDCKEQEMEKLGNKMEAEEHEHLVASWNSHIGVPWCLKWAPRRAMFAAASTVLTFWIPNNEPKAEYGGTDAEPGPQPQPLN
ncbi:WD repeat-containing protein 82-B-like [Trifolium pratense]|uniref:WD repeat-containing protein 82-B-like n=1 Tax=Trifolium pratense TaxID=57577 RepID=A0A2K3PDM7_TRIPR|nr:WD repeat-containing protein 82-B-like [Trifolium pratense]